MIECSFLITHVGDWSETLNDDFPDVKTTTLYSYRPGMNTAMIIEATNITDPDVLADWLNEHSAVVDAEIMSYAAEHERAYYVLEVDYEVSEAPRSVLDTLTRHQCFPTLPISNENGRERWTVVAPTREHLRDAHEDLKELGPVEILTLTSPQLTQTLSGLAEIKSALNDLSPRQREVLKAAIENGYYQSPRGTTLEELAETDSANLSTIGDHLRRSEGKIIPSILNLL